MSETRMNKYKKLRESLREDVRVQQPAIEVDDSEDDFLAFIPKANQEVDHSNFEPKSYETLVQDEETEEAISFVKNSADNTKVDIYRQIRSEERRQDYGPYGPYHASDLETGHEVKREDKQSSFIDRIIAMSPEEDVEEFRKFQEEESKKQEKVGLGNKVKTTTDTFVADDKPITIVDQDIIVDDIDEEEKKDLDKISHKFFVEVEDEETDSHETMITNIIIAVLIVVFIIVLIVFFFL
ncbi:MAG: hypothetical protein J6P61_09570 [Erysipelotrichaceae bacterium]|nr:hypothetical protein [Erysipelotrichaceae bacterium]